MIKYTDNCVGWVFWLTKLENDSCLDIKKSKIKPEVVERSITGSRSEILSYQQVHVMTDVGVLYLTV